MKIVFVSNYFNHHQKPLCDALWRLTGGAFHFIQTAEMREERKKLGYGDAVLPEYVVSTLNGREAVCVKWIEEADVMICGSAPEKLIRRKLCSGSLVFRYSERPLKNGIEPMKYLPRFLRWHYRNPMGKPIYMLCASGYTSWEYSKLLLFRNRCYKWGYFTQTKQYDADALMKAKDHKKILWVARLLPLKHPDDVIRVAKRLRDDGCDFTMDLIGIGEMEDQLRQMIGENNLSDRVRLLGSMKPDQVREHMEQAGIFLFTSDKQEGWGAVLNESMNSGCAVVGSHAIGSVPYLMEHEQNGLVYRSGDLDDLYEKVRRLLVEPQTQERLGRQAYDTITGMWNGEVAAQRLVCLAEQILAGQKYPHLYEEGPCSEARIIKDDWFK